MDLTPELYRHCLPLNTLLFLVFLSLPIMTTRSNAALSAVPVILKFDPPSLTNGSRSLNTYIESGIVFTGTLSGSFSHTDTGVSLRPDNGTAHFNITRLFTQMRYQDNRLFRLNRLDIAEYSTVFASPQTITLKGYKSDNSSVTFTFTTDGVIDSTGPRVDFQTVALPATFSDLQRVEFASATFSIDNVSVTPVPETAAVATVLLALCLPLVRRRRGPA